MYLENIKVDAFFKLQDADKFAMYFNTLKANNLFRGVSLDEQTLTYSNILVLKESYSQSTITDYFTIYEICYNQTPISFLNGSILEFIQTNRYILNLLKTITEREQKMLESESDVKWSQAGGERMDIFGGKAIMIQLGEQFNKSPREIGDWLYSEVFMIQLYNSRLNSVMKNYHKIK